MTEDKKKNYPQERINSFSIDGVNVVDNSAKKKRADLQNSESISDQDLKDIEKLVNGNP